MYVYPVYFMHIFAYIFTNFEFKTYRATYIYQNWNRELKKNYKLVELPVS